MSTWSSLSHDIEAAVSAAAPSIVQVHGRRRMAAGIIVARDIVITPASTDEDTVAVLIGDGQATEGAVLGRAGNTGLTVVRVDNLDRQPLSAAEEPKPGHLAVAVGRTWSGGIMSALAPVSVVGGPLRTGRGSAIERVIRIQQAPHGALNGGALIDADGRALGIITSMAIRGTTVVIPARIAWAAAAQIQRDGGAQQGFIGVSSMPVALPERQRAGRSQGVGLLISHVAKDSPAEAGGLLVGDVIVGFGGDPIQEPEELITRLRGNHIGKGVPVTVIRGTSAVDVTVTVAERPKPRG